MGAKKGSIPWNRGLTNETDERVVIAWNKGLTKDTDERIKKGSVKNEKKVLFTCTICKKTEYLRPYEARVRKFCSRECYYASHRGKITYKLKLCLICGKEFSITSKNKNKRYCSKGCYRKSRLNNNFEHSIEIQRQVKILTSQGFNCIAPDFRPRPDIIAIKDGKVFAVEVEFGIPDTKKYNDVTSYDDIWWIVIRDGKVKKE